MIDEGVNALGWVIFFCVFNMPFGGWTSNRSAKTFASFTTIFCIYKVKNSWLFRLASTPCSAPALKRAFLFSCLTALRKSDIKKLTWEEIQPYGSDGVMLSLIKTTFFLYFSLAYALFAQTDLFRSYYYFLSVCHPKHR